MMALLSPLFAEIKIIYESKAHDEFMFEHDGVYGYIESGTWLPDKKKKVMSYEEFLREKCNGRDYTIIAANFGGKYRDNFVIDCKDK